MSTDNFVNKINRDNIPQIITRCFDEIMILYNLIGTKKDITISVDNDSPSTKFILEMKSEEEANNLFDNLNNSFFSVYEDKFIIEMELSGRSIYTKIYKAIS